MIKILAKILEYINVHILIYKRILEVSYNIQKDSLERYTCEKELIRVCSRRFISGKKIDFAPVTYY